MKKKTEQREITWVDVHDDELMVSLGIHLPNVTPRDPEVWTKTNKEKNLLRKLRNKFKNVYMSGSITRQKPIPFHGKLIVRIKPDKRFVSIDKNGNHNMKTTFSYDNVCQSEIPTILSKFSGLIIYYTYFGKEYKYNELPFWYD